MSRSVSVSNRRIDHRRLEKEVTLLLNKHRKFGPGGMMIGTIGLEMLYLFGSNGIVASPDYALLSKAILCVEESARSLDPDFDIQAVAQPFLVGMSKERWSWESVMRQTAYPFLSMLRRLQQIQILQRILQRFEDEDIRVNLHHTGTEDLEKRSIAR